MTDKKYTFRLLKEDKELADYLDQIPPRKRSLVIRHMLRSAFEQAINIQHQMQALEQIQEQLQEMKTLQETCLKQIKEIQMVQPTAQQIKSHGTEKGSIRMEESAKAFLSMFGGA